MTPDEILKTYGFRMDFSGDRQGESWIMTGKEMAVIQAAREWRIQYATENSMDNLSFMDRRIKLAAAVDALDGPERPSAEVCPKCNGIYLIPGTRLFVCSCLLDRIERLEANL